MTARTCTVDGCDRPIDYLTMCNRHYKANRAPLKGTRARWSTLFAATTDENVILRLMDGEHVPHTSYERREAVRRLVARGTPKQAVSRQLGIHQRQVYRDLAVVIA